MKKYRFYTLIMATTWIFVTGSANIETFISGLMISFPIIYALRRFYPGETNIEPAKIVHIVHYVANFSKELLLSNLNVAYRVLHPSMPINPEKIRYKTELSHPTAVTILANSITLTPGTLVIDYLEDEKELVIHCLNLENREDEVEGIRNWEKILKKILGDSK